jgi:methanogenic corrinoid protein MtbC1
MSEVMDEEKDLVKRVGDPRLSELAVSIMREDLEGSERAARAALESHLSPKEILMKGCCEGLRSAGNLFLRKSNTCMAIRTLSVGDVVMILEAFLAAVEVLKPSLRAEKSLKLGTVVIGVMKDDFHDYGNKYFVTPSLEAVGYQICDLGVEVPADKFVQMALSNKAIAVIVASTRNKPIESYLRQINGGLKAAGIRNQLVCMVGGENVLLTEKVTSEAGFDAYVPSCFWAVGRLLELTGNK